MKIRHYLLIFVACFVLFTFLAREPLVTVYHARVISQSPVETTVTKTELITDGKGNFKDYWVDFYYQVNGNEYNFRSLNTSQKGAKIYMTTPKYRGITYASDSPDVAMLTAHYKLRQKENPAQVVSIVLIGVAVVSLLLTLLIAFVMFLINRKRQR